jgi:hypothetical protein
MIYRWGGTQDIMRDVAGGYPWGGAAPDNGFHPAAPRMMESPYLTGNASFDIPDMTYMPTSEEERSPP